MAFLIVLLKYLHGHNLHNLHVVINLSKASPLFFLVWVENAWALGFRLTFILMRVYG